MRLPTVNAAADRDWGRRALGAGARRRLTALTEAVLCEVDGEGRLIPPPPALVDRVVDGIDVSIGCVSQQAQRVWMIGLLLIELLPLFFILRPRRMSRLPLAQRLFFVERLEASRVGLLAAMLSGFKVSICIQAFEAGSELQSTGFDRSAVKTRRQLPTHAPQRSQLQDANAPPRSQSQDANTPQHSQPEVEEATL